ncbi:MAG TPA: class I SAM-dependent methyltransferase [Anaerolineales bacterium]|nr:class I SAM-dependent methyltransferase [Anaerolineales bacterium]
MNDGQLDRVADYYERNTRRFLRFGRGAATATIHRRLWMPGVADPHQALRSIHLQIAAWLDAALAASGRHALVLDLGCGVGGPAIDVAAQTNSDVVGLTLSRLQARQAHVRTRSDPHSPQFIVADFHALPLRCQAAGAYAIESFAHAADPGRFFAEARACLSPGGRLIVVDDFLAEGKDAAGHAGFWDRDRWIRRFVEGWRLGSLMTAFEAANLAAAAGLNLVQVEDLTRWIRLPPGWLLALLRTAAVLRLPSSYWESQAGGVALQVCEQRGWVRYQGLVFDVVS